MERWKFDEHLVEMASKVTANPDYLECLLAMDMVINNEGYSFLINNVNLLLDCITGGCSMELSVLTDEQKLKFFVFKLRVLAYESGLQSSFFLGIIRGRLKGKLLDVLLKDNFANINDLETFARIDFDRLFGDLIPEMKYENDYFVE